MNTPATLGATPSGGHRGRRGTACGTASAGTGMGMLTEPNKTLGISL
jgi:hypothetical protein